MSAIDNIARKAASNAITKYGKAVVFRKLTAGARNPATLKTDVSENQYPARALVENYTAYQINGTTIRAGDLKLTIAAQGNELPELGWFVDFNNLGEVLTYSVVMVESVFSGEQAALYICQVRK